MTAKEKKVVFTLIGVMIVILLIVLVVKAFGNAGNDKQNIADSNKVINNTGVGNKEKYSAELNDGTKLNTSEDLQNKKTYKTVEIDGIQVTTDTNGNSAIIANIKNTGSTTFVAETVSITLLGENNTVIRKLDVGIPELKAGETKQLNHMVTGSIANIKDFKVEAK